MIHFSLLFLHHRPVYAIIEARGYRKLDRTRFKNELLSSPLCGDLTTLERKQPEKLFKLYEDTFQKIIDSMLPVRKVRTGFQPNAPWFDAECRQQWMGTCFHGWSHLFMDVHSQWLSEVSGLDGVWFILACRKVPCLDRCSMFCSPPISHRSSSHLVSMLTTMPMMFRRMSTVGAWRRLVHLIGSTWCWKVYTGGCSPTDWSLIQIKHNSSGSEIDCVFKICTFVMNSISVSRVPVPTYLPELCVLSSVNSVRDLQSSDKLILKISRCRTATLQQRGFSVVGPVSWNGLPLELRLLFNDRSTSTFKKRLETFLFSKWSGKLAELFWRALLRIVLSQGRYIKIKYLLLTKDWLTSQQNDTNPPRQQINTLT